jgi:threonine synthase
VPSGNVGNLYAGLLAREMGLPVKAFVAASNLNRTVPDFLETGEYRPRPSVQTLSSAMDMGSPSNWERIHQHFKGNLVAMREVLRGGSLDDQATRRAMWELHHYGYLPDPHGAVAYGVLEERRGLGETGIFLATAHPAKFGDLLRRDMNLELEPLPGLAETLTKPILAKPLANDLEALKKELMA